jgi:hypothetical protein
MFSGNSLFFPRRAVAMVAGVSTPVSAQSTTVSTVSITPTGFTAATAGGGGVNFVTLDIQTSNVRVRFDGTAPTATVGTLLYVGTNYTWNVDLYNNAKFIRDTSASADATIFAHPLNA